MDEIPIADFWPKLFEIVQTAGALGFIVGAYFYVQNLKREQRERDERIAWQIKYEALFERCLNEFSQGRAVLEKLSQIVSKRRP